MKIKGLLKNNWVKWGIIPVLLVGLWIFLTFLYILIYDQGFTTLSYNHEITNLILRPQERILKGQKISGQFVAQRNNLGTVSIRFKQEQRIPWKDEDILIFRMKEKGAKEWYYQNKYYSGLTYDVPLLPIGFPIIHDSKGKTYYFEFQSTRGNSENGLILSDRYPILVSKYIVDKQELLHDPKKLLDFLYVKFTYSLSTPDVLFSSFIYLLPLIFYILWNMGLGEFLTKKFGIMKYLEKVYSEKEKGSIAFLFLIVLIVMYDIVFLQVLNDMLYVAVIFLWVILLKVAKIDNKITFFTALAFLIIAPIALQVDNKSIEESAGAWAFIFLCGGVFVSLFELRKEHA